jgi:guanine deaminase
MVAQDTVFYGAVVNPVDLSSFQALPRAALAVTAAGEIAWIEEDVESSSLQEILGARGWLDADVVELRLGEFLLPGFIDTHTVRSQ